MHPNVFLRTFWQMEFKPQVFVAMTFSPQYQIRFDEIIAPAVRSISIDGIHLEPNRVDLSKSGDSIIREIMDGIAHSRIILADVSSVGKDSVTGVSYRNGNVMYEVGVALSCRRPEEVLLIRDDKDKFLFDVSTIPHLHLDFAEKEKAREQLKSELMERLNQQTYIKDVRVEMAIASLSGGEIKTLKYIAGLSPGDVWGRQEEGDVVGFVSIPRLLDKQLIRMVGEFEEGYPAYQATYLGSVVAKLVGSGFQQFNKIGGQT